nr:MAG TPA: hypothetical protein [Caudoviricetes sp.]
MDRISESNSYIEATVENCNSLSHRFESVFKKGNIYPEIL